MDLCKVVTEFEVVKWEDTAKHSLCLAEVAHPEKQDMDKVMPQILS